MAIGPETLHRLYLAALRCVQESCHGPVEFETFFGCNKVISRNQPQPAVGDAVVYPSCMAVSYHILSPGNHQDRHLQSLKLLRFNPWALDHKAEQLRLLLKRTFILLFLTGLPFR